MLERRDLCSGCGQRLLEDLQPVEAIASLRLLQRRSAALLRRGRRDGEAFGAPNGAMPRPAVESAAAIAARLAAADRTVRRLLGETDSSGPASPTLRIFAATASGSEIPAGLALVSETVERLVASVAGATTEDWHRRRRLEGVSAAEVLWLALHDAVHHLEDVELAVAQLSSPSESNRDPVAEDPAAGDDERWDGAVVAMTTGSLTGSHGTRSSRPPGRPRSSDAADRELGGDPVAA